MAKRVRVQPRFFVFLLLMLAGIVFLSIQAFGKRTFEVTTNIIGDIKTVPAVIVRDEAVRISDSGSYRPNYFVAEGEDVQKDQPVVELLNTGLTQAKQDDLTKVREEISLLLARSISGDIVDADMDNLNQQVDTLAGQIGSLIRGESGGQLIDLEAQLRTVMDQRQDYMRKAAHTDNELQKLYDKEKQLVNNIDTWKTVVNAEVSGRLSLQFDRYEDMFKPEFLERFTPENVRKFLNGKTAETTSTEKLFRIVNPYRWYVCALSSDTSWQPGVDAAVTVTFEGYQASYSGKVVSVGRDDKDMLVTLEMTQDIGPMINVRKVTAQIGDQATGLAVPHSAIRNIDGVDCVVLADSNTPVPVRIVNRDKKYALIESITPDAVRKGTKVVLK